MQERIQQVLTDIEQKANVRIVYACESGSRAWGFPSANSDYDVRFIYLRPKHWYLSIDVEHHRDVIEQPISDQLDINGWDLRKALKLFRKSNPPLLEWLHSPIIYLDDYSVADDLRKLLPVYYSPIASFYHYLHMAKGNLRDYLQGDIVWVKKYFYVLRPLLAMKWIEEGRGIVPMAFDTLVQEVVGDEAVRQEITNLLERKKRGDELAREPRIPIISDFIEREIEQFKAEAVTPDQNRRSIETLDELFRQVLDKVWQPQSTDKI
ncbi:MAG: nucleotidyltransferase domain-containing protein [Anaerolineae bacterium]|nr:nucleotidyltransferase domain-containing protein [Anaerolineae bacterium]